MDTQSPPGESPDTAPLHFDARSQTPAGWHRVRRAAMLAAYPDLRALTGPYPWTAAWVVALVIVQLGVAYALRHAPWYVLLGAAWFVGAFVVHALGVLIHECTHNLVFHRPAANKVVAILANVPMVLPGAIDFREKHLAHHRHLGEGEELDFQLPTARDTQWTGTSRVRKMLWIAFGSLFSARSLKLDRGPADPWLKVNLIAQIVTIVPFVIVAGPRALIYLLLSGMFSFGPHPVSMRGFAEHFDRKPGQPTNSYYGPLNLVSFDVGYHVEHHDLPAVPWARLRELRRRAAPFYDRLTTTPSWGGLLVRLALDPALSVGRYVRAPQRKNRASSDLVTVPANAHRV
ncbi:Putative fatty acid desaturase MLD [Minicystis rosea]|nr:Putative fatty acid desaturase MLD [Minicystis rosea]